MSMLECFDESKLRCVLGYAALNNYSVQPLIIDQYDQVVRLQDEKRQAEQAKVIDFSCYSSDAWHALNKKYASGKGSKEYMLAGQACSDIKDCIESIAEQATPDTSYGTKKNALETLRKIGKTICLGDGVIGHEVRKDFQYESCLQDVMMGILNSMDRGEIESLANSADEKGTFLKKVKELVGEAEGYCILQGIEDVQQELVGGGIDGEEEEEAEEEEEQEEE